MPHDRVILIGYRGTGKTTVGRLLAAELGWGFADADDRVEEVAGVPILGIFAAEGEAGFRDREAAALRELCARPHHVVATGGGAILRSGNRELFRASGFVAWLTASPETVWGRLRADPATAARRPNLTSAGGIEEVRALIAAREPLYRKTADFTFDTDSASPEAAAAAILTAWRGSNSPPSSSGPSGPSSSA
jgi:shikimate kinase